MQHSMTFGAVDNIAATVRRHWVFLAVFTVAIGLRVAVEVTYWPGLLYSDSWSYVGMAYGSGLVRFGDWFPSGYPLILHLLTLPDRDFGVVTVTQHLAGLLTGVIVYVGGLRLGVHRWLAALAAGLFLLDGYVISSEQWIASDSFFTLCLTLSIVLLVTGGRSSKPTAASGLLLAASITIRVIGFAAVPAWVTYLLWTRKLRLISLVGVLTLMIPIGSYMALHAAAGRGVGFTQSEGWLLYGRVAEIANCRDLTLPKQDRALCPNDQIPHPYAPEAWIWESRSPAVRTLGTPGAENDATVRAFALEVIRQRPLSYLEIVSRDFLLTFRPGSGYLGQAITLPSPHDTDVLQEVGPDQSVRSEYFPKYHRQIRSGFQTLRSYVQIAHTQRWLLGALALIAVMVLLAGFTRLGAELRFRAEIFLLVGTALSILVVTVAINEYQTRTVLPVIPLLLLAGVVAFEDIFRALRNLNVKRPQLEAASQAVETPKGPSGPLNRDGVGVS